MAKRPVFFEFSEKKCKTKCGHLIPLTWSCETAGTAETAWSRYAGHFQGERPHESAYRTR